MQEHKETAQRMQEHIEAVQRMQDYIHGHLFDEISLGHLAKASFFSPWYSHRLFSKYTGMNPAEYIRKLRLTKSALRLRDDDCKVTDLAFECGFESVDGYQRAFLREFGCNPGDYASHPKAVYLFTPYGVKFRFLERRETVENLRNVFIQVIEKPARKVLIKRGIKADEYWTYCQEVGCDVWGLLTSIKDALGEPVCMWLPEKYRKPNTSVYVQGVEVAEDYNGEIPEGLDVITLPKSKYLAFQGEPFAEEDYCKAIEELKDSIEKYNPNLIGYEWDKTNPRIQLEPVGDRGYIELLPVTQKK